MRRSKRQDQSPPVVELGSVRAAVPVSRLSALEQQREWLTNAMEVAALAEPKSVAGISRELRAVWAEIEALGQGETVPADDLEIVAGGLNVVPLNAGSA